MYGEQFNIAHLEPASHIYGPGRRFVIWLQGCTLACSGCWNTQMWSSRPNQLIERELLLAQIFACEGLTGITLLGGEPLQQSENCLWLLERVREGGLDTVVYSGYELSEINADLIRSKILHHCDILIVGRYDQRLRNLKLQWRGSENQQLLFLSDKYDARLLADANEVELIIDEQGAATLLGYPQSPDLIHTLIE